VNHWDFRALGRREAAVFFREFEARLPERIKNLESYIRATPGFKSWRADYSEESLARMGRWFLTVMETRPRTKKEIADLEALESPIFRDEPIDQMVFTDKTISVIADMGIYLVESVRHARPKWKWERQRGSKNNIDYNAPVLMIQVKNGRIGMNPFMLGCSSVSEMKDGSNRENDYRDMFNTWIKIASHVK